MGHTVFAVGRFLTALAGLLVKPRWILLFLYLGVIVTAALAMSTEGYTGVAMIVLILLFESGIFSLIFSMCIRGLGVHTKMGAVALTASTTGGAIIPAVMSRVSDHRGLRYSFAVVLAVFAFGSLLPFYTTVVTAAKNQVDPVHPFPETDATDARPVTSKRASRVLNAIRRRNKDSAETPRVDHVDSEEKREPG